MSDEAKPYKPDRRLGNAFAEANLHDPAGLEGLCPDFEELRRIKERYMDGELLGTGSLKQVWKCWDARARRWVAMARLREDRGAEYYDLFVHEARITSSLNHPNIIKVYNLGADSVGRPFFTMDLKGESTLADYSQPFDLGKRRELLAIFLVICEAVAHAHERGVLHLDLKPENIQVDRLGEVLVCDWGLAKRKDEACFDDEPAYPGQTESVGNLTLMGEIRGTPGYMAPEQVISGAVKDRRTDVFALGCILHYILTGFAPIRASSQEELLEKTRSAKFPHPGRLYPQCNIPESLTAVILKACAVSPADRYSSAAELASEMRKHLTGFATAAEEPSFFRAAGFFIKRHRLPVSIFVASLLCIGGVSAWFLNDLQQERERVVSERERAEQEKKNAETQRQKAEDYASEASMLDSLYKKELKSREESRRELANKMAQSSNSLKNLGIFISPVRTVQEAEELSSLALQLNPKDALAREEAFSLQCLKMNFKAALQVKDADQLDKGWNLGAYEIAKTFPDYEFSQQSRPSAQQLVDYIHKIGEMRPNMEGHVERVLYYDHCTRKGGLPSSAFIAFLEYMNRGVKDFSVEYEQEARKLTVRSSGNILLSGLTNKGGSDESLLRFMPVRHLVLECSGSINLGDLDEQSVEVLDISKCSKANLNRTITLPALKQVITREAPKRKDRLKQFIRSTHQWEFIPAE